MFEKMRRIATMMVAVMALTTIDPAAAFAAAPTPADSYEDANWPQLAQAAAELGDPLALGTITVTCKVNGPGEDVLDALELTGAVGETVEFKFPEFSGYTRLALATDANLLEAPPMKEFKTQGTSMQLTIADQPQSFTLWYQEAASRTKAPSRNHGKGTDNSDNHGTGSEPPVASDNDATPNHGDDELTGDDVPELTPPVVAEDETYDEIVTWWIAQDIDGTWREERTIETPNPDGTVSIEKDVEITHPDGRKEFGHETSVRQPDGSEEMISGEWTIELPPIIHYPTYEEDETSQTETDDSEDSEEFTDCGIIDLGTITPIAGVPMRVDEDGRLYTEVGGERHYYD